MEVCLCLSHHSHEDSPSLRPKAPPSLVAAGSVKGELRNHLKETFCPFHQEKASISLQLSCPPAYSRMITCLFYSLATEKPKDTLSDTLWKWLYDRFGLYIEDFRFQPEEHVVETEEPLSAKR